MRRSKGTSGCPMLRQQKLQKLFKNEVWSTDAMDIEDLVQLGSKIGTCPYYGARNMVPSSDIIVLPYQSLFLRSARESLSINLKKSIIIIDEAHNLADSLTNMYNAKISETQLKRILDVLEFYINKFRSCLGPGNRRYIQTLIVLIQSFLQKLHEFLGTSSYRDEQGIKGSLADTSMTINDFLFSLNIDNLNLVKLHRYIKDSKIIHKISGYGTKLASLQSHNSICSDSQNNSEEGSILSGFQTLDNIIISLVHNDRDGRILLSRPKLSGQKEEGYIKFMMLSGHTIFSEVLDQAYGVVLAGGTLQPIEETRVRLFPNLSRDEVHFYTCNHIVPPESILPIVVSHGPSGVDFDFSYNSRNSLNMIGELGRLLCNLVAIVPEGFVVFFSSFDYEGRVYDAWKASGVLSKISKKKIVYREPKSSNDVEHVLKKYKETIASCDTILKDTGINGAVLLAVVGGKISEGINLSDGMGRCILMVGLPYPSPDIELIERVQHIEGLGQAIPQRCNKPFRNSSNDGHEAESGFGFLRRCKQRGKEYYENLCMKAVNQSIGRAIRHVNDYAAVLLVDSRYACSQLSQNMSHPTNKLPLWIKQRLVSSTQNYGEVHRLLHKFFQFNRQKRHTGGAEAQIGLGYS
ncbi:ATP-dependent DNA helicase DDX11 isoform X2 [Zingiber officinale]|nr:ATP-dependent DNA helicase DDX11 isoform X2 [Zingiber officinale]